LRPHHFASKPKQPKDFQGWQGTRELGGFELGYIEPFLHREGLSRSIPLQQTGKMLDGQLRVFLSHDFHTLIFGVGRNVVPQERKCK